MYVKCDKDELKAISTGEMDGTAEFSNNNIAQVTESDGKALLEAFPEQFSEHNTEDN